MTADNLTLVFPDESHEKEYFAMMDEWITYGGRLNPSALRLKGLTRYQDWLKRVLDESGDQDLSRGKVPQTTYFLMAEDRIYGAVSIRHELNEGLLKTGGHIGYGIRPSERRKGYATKMLGLALIKCAELGIECALVTCDRDNVASAKVIENNGGVYENEELDEKGLPVKRYWIKI